MAAQATNNLFNTLPFGFPLPSPPASVGAAAQPSLTGFADGCAAAVAPDVTPPVVSNFAPAPGTTLDPSDQVEFDVTDDSGTFARNLIAVAFADGTQELVYDGATFTARYLAQSTVAPTVVGSDAGVHFRLRRTGGWLGAAITVRAFSVDSSGNTES